MKKSIYEKILTYFTIAIFLIMIYFNVLQIRTLREDVNDLRIKQEINWARVQGIITMYQRTLENLTEDFKVQIDEIKLQHNINKSLQKSINYLKDHTLPPLYEQLQEANYMLTNTTVGVLGSGTLIKIKDKYFILTCAHLTNKETDFIWAENTISNNTYPLQLIKIDKKNDLAIYRIYINMFEDEKNIIYCDLGEEEPKVGENVYAIGNPSGWEDILTSGIIAKKDNNTYLFTAPIFFGNSGGALIYKGKIAGVNIAMLSSIQYMGIQGDFLQGFFPYFQDIGFGVSVRLKIIKKFLEGIE